MSLNSGPRNAPSAVRRFADVLRQTLHDAEHEVSPNGKVVHYWDSSCLFLPARGFLGFQSDVASADDRVVHALFSSGYLGSVSMTRSHRTEFLGEINKWIGSDLEHKVSYADRLDEFLARNEFDSLKRVLPLIGGDNAEAQTVQIEEAIRSLRSVDRRTFAYVESISGPWASRVKRLLGNPLLLSLDSPGPTTSQILEDPLFDEFVEGIKRCRTRSLPISTAIDAAALTSIAILNRDARSDGSSVYPRFYTASPVLIQLFNSERWVRDVFSFPFTTQQGLSVAGSIWRDAYYYLLRAFLPALSRTASVDRSVGPSRQELASLATDLSGALQAGDGELLTLAERHLFSDGTALSELIGDLESAGMARVWLSYDVGDAALAAMEGLRTLRTLRTFEGTVQTIDSLLNSVERELRSDVADIRLSVEVAGRVRSSLARAKPVNSGGSISLAEDLGAIRWGLDTSGSDEVRIPTGPGAARAYAEILAAFDIDRLSGDVDEAERAVAILLGIEAYELAHALVERIDPSRSSSLMLMRNVAKVSSNARSERGQSETLADMLVSEWEALEAADQERLCLGFGYGFFAAWRNTSDAILMETQPADAGGWARRSYEVVQRFLASGSAEQRMFALNHLVFVGTVADLEEPALAGLAADLERVADEEGQFRFLDTCGYRRYLLALRGRESTLSVDDWKAAHCGSLDVAHNLLQRALRAAPRDREVARHLETLTSFAGATGCPVSGGL